MKILAISLVIALCLPSISRCDNCTFTKYSSEYYRKRCGFMGWDRCGAYRSVAYEVSRCCDGWIGSECDIALCNNQTDGCSLREGMVRLRNGTVYTNGGGSCVQPDVCEGCNPGYYASGPYCEACELANCLHPECNSSDDAVCKYCEGEVKEQYGWYAYTRSYPGDEHKCRQACSWRPGKRCYPGTCSDQTPNSCRCTDGFKGPDCDTITEAPDVLQNSIRLTELTEKSANHIDAPADSSGGSPQDITWTNNAGLKQFTALVDASYKKDLPTPPAHFYVNMDQTKIGIINGGYTLEWIRGSSTVASVIRTECETEPTPTNYRCESTASFNDHNWHGLFEHQDILKFTVFATNGGYVAVYNRENNDRIDKYIVTGETTTRSFEIKFDLEKPEHCIMDSAGCSTQPITLQDLTEKASITLRWSGWTDHTSGLSNYAFEVFSLIPTGSDPDSRLVYGEKIRDAVIAQLPPDASQTMVTLPSAGLYAVTVSAYDVAGNHRTARRFVIFDDNSVVSLQGTRTFKADSDGSCTWKTYPSHPLITNADPNANCNWITKQSPVIDLAWRERFINAKHDSGKLLNPVKTAADIDQIFDDGDGIRTTEKIDNVLGITSFEVAYNVTFESETTRYSYVKIDNLQAQRFSIVEDISDGMKLNMQIRGSDIFGSFAEDAIEVKVDTSPPEIEDLWLMKGDIRTFLVHNVEDLTRLQIEWKAFDIHSGLEEMKWRIFDNFTGTDIEHGTAYLSPQGDTKNKDQCINLYGDYPRGADCYCTPFEGCFHKYFQVKPQIDMRGTNGLHKSKHLGIHDSDYFIEVSATNKAMLKTTQTVKITIDISPPVAGTVHEGAQGEPEIDFQQEKTVKVHWNDFFDRESGIWMYRYGYGAECLKPEDFDIETGKELTQTDQTEATFAVEKEGKYFVTVAAYNYALDHSTPVCSDGVTVDTSVPSVLEFEVEGAKADPRLLRDDAGYLWFLHDDRTRQQVSNSNEACRASVTQIPTEQIELIPILRNYQGVAENITFDGLGDCSGYLVDSVTVLSAIHNWRYINVSWTVIESKSGVYDFEIGISTTKSEVPDLLDFKSSNHHTHLTISHPNINDGSVFYFIIKTVSRSGVENIQSVGPFILLSGYPSFKGEIVVSYYEENGQEYLIASWDENAFEDVHELVRLEYQFAVGTSKYGADVHPFSNLNFLSSCKPTVPPTCTAVSFRDLAWDIHHGQEYYITIRVNNTAGLISRQCSKPYKHDVLAPFAGIVIDIDPNAPQKVKDNDDIDYQKSKTSLSGRWYGFEHFYSAIDYTACITDAAGVVLKDTCKFVGTDTNATLEGAQLQVFKKYKVKVIAETDVTSVSASSDGVIIIDPNKKLVNVMVHDGKHCSGDTVLLEKVKTHYDQDVLHSCFNDITHQASVHKLSSYWEIPDEWKMFTPDLYWHIEERAPTVDYWTSRTKEVHTWSSSAEISINFPLIPGRSYRFGLKFCAADICYNTLYTNGVTVIPNPPKTGQMFVSYSTETKKIEAIFERFYDADIEKLTEAQEVMDFYEWNIADNDAKGRVAKKWSRLNNIHNVNETHMQFAIELEEEIQFTKCWNFLLKGTNKVGLYSVLAKNIKPCQHPEMVKAATVIDCVASHSFKDTDAPLSPVFAGDPVVLGVNEDWAEDDMDYTPYKNIISAVWPKLRYKMYNWAVIEIHNNDPVLYYSDNPILRNPCDSPGSIFCNTTDRNYVNVDRDAEPLNDGHRYAVCIHAEATVLEHEYWKEYLPEISLCSDGITVDTTPPSPGNVWIYHRDAIYQSSNSEVTVYWERFIDIEELGTYVHASGISHYMVALGSHFGGVDVVPLTNVGICSHYTFHDLKLQDGHSYFATVVGYDFTGRHSNSTSAAIVIDTTPPVKSNRGITIGKRFITDQSFIEACWQEVFSDPDSGMASYKWGIGSQPGYDDKYSFSETFNTCSHTAEGQSLTLDDGHSYFVTVLGFNNAGLFSIATSWAYTVDTSPPVTGYVNDGERKPGGTSFDLDYQTEGSMIFAHWVGFSDPHTALKEFLVSVGTTKGGQDVVETQEIGLATEIEIRHLQLRDGMTYYVSVTACNVADLCTTATSDGILIDSSPPVPGRVIDGTGNKDIRYQASRTFVGAKWFGFTDPQSGLSHFTWRIGTAALADDIVPAREVHLSEIAVIPDLIRALNKQLPTNKMIYNTIRAYNKGGLFSEASSNGFIVDNTSPTVKMPLTHVPIGSLLTSTSVLRSSLKVKWSVEDSDSFISRQYLSIAAHRGEDFNTSLKIGGFIRDYTFTKLQFHDGSLYNIKLIACNGAKLCVSSTLPNLLVDSSAPIAGTFASNTDHAVSHKLDRQPENWMVWERSNIHLAWLGFSDIHSGIQETHINIGSSFMASDLNEDQNQQYVVPSQSMEEEDKDDLVQTRTINTQTLKNDEHIFISMWALNGVGLKSEIIQSQFRLEPGGHLQLVRRCNGHTCHGHCVCAAQDRKCAIDSKIGSCVDKTGDTTYSEVEVQDVISMIDELDDSLAGSHSPTDMMLSAKWSCRSGAKPLWYEWSVGETEYSTPLGIIESDDRLWHDAGSLLSWTFTLPKGSYLLDGERYSFFVRAWFNENTFSDFKSKGVVVQITAPQTTSLFRKAVKETRDNSPNDIDFVRPDDVFFVSWDGKFKNPDTSVSRYRFFISSEPNGADVDIDHLTEFDSVSREKSVIGHDIYVSEEDIAPHTTRYNLTGIYKEPNTRFYSNIIAYNAAGLSTVVSSDGCHIDKEIPVDGVVFDGLGYREKCFQNSTSIVSASWQGFVDFGSSLRSYHWCVSPADFVGSCTVLPSENVGLVTRAERKLLSPVTNGIKLVSEIFATDQVGHNSTTALSNGVIVDETPPVRLHHVFYGENLLMNPSFENTPSAVSLAYLEITNTCLFDNPTDWIVSDDGCSTVVTAAADMVEDGISFLALKGSISQTVPHLNIQSFYRLRILTSHLPLDSATKSNNEGFVEFDGNKRLFMLYSKPRRSDNSSVQMSWHLHTFVFKPRSEEVTIRIGSYENAIGLAIDNIQLQESFTKEKDARESEGNIEVYMVFQHDWSSVHASWNFYDGESGVKEYLWAIGTVQGGIQLQDFKSVGERAFASKTDLYMPHNSTIYVTVVAVNGADIRTVSYSDPVRVDLTPPVFEYVNDGTVEGKNLDYQDSWHIGVNFKISDPESAISLCSWGIGIQPGDVSLRPFEVIESGLNSAEDTMKSNDKFKTLFVTVRCANKAGLQATKSSDGITILERKPVSDVLAVELLGQSPSQYIAHSHYHGTRGQLRIRLTGFGEDQMIDKYKIALKGPSYDFISYVHEYSPGYIYAKFSDLTLEDGLYNITVVGINRMDIESDPLVTSLTVLTVPPKIKADIKMVWNRSQQEVSISWSDVFLSNSPLYYEVSAGSVGGSGDIIQWQETVSTELIFALNQDEVGPYGKTIYVVVRAITLSGTYSTAEKDQLITLND